MKIVKEHGRVIWSEGPSKDKRHQTLQPMKNGENFYFQTPKSSSCRDKGENLYSTKISSLFILLRKSREEESLFNRL